MQNFIITRFYLIFLSMNINISYFYSLSGSNSSLYENQTYLENVLNEGNDTWEITNYLDVRYRFTVWEYFEKYNTITD